jgi:ribosome recycling factor
MSDLNGSLAESNVKMNKAIDVAKEDFATIRTGRAHPSMFAKLMVDYYGTGTPLAQLATVQIPEARLALITPYDKGAMAAIEKAIRDSDLGVNPGSDGTAKSKAEDSKVAIRAIRRAAKEAMEKLEKDGKVGKDDLARAEKELEKVTGEHTAKIDELLKHKEAELLEV